MPRVVGVIPARLASTRLPRKVLLPIAGKPMLEWVYAAASGSGVFDAVIEAAGFRIAAIKKLSISKPQAAGFYAVHAARPFFDSLTTFMSSGPIYVMVLEKENAIADLRKLMGATNPANAEEGTVRKKFASSIEENAIHGSDAAETAQFEIGYFFAGYELE